MAVHAGSGFAVQQGVLRFDVAGASGHSGNKYTVSSGAAIELNASFGSVNAEQTISGSGIGNAGAIRSLGGDLTFGTTAGSGSLTLAADSSIGVDAGSLEIGFAIGQSGGARSLTKVGDGLLTLSNANTFSGSTTISGGILSLTNADALQNSALDTANSIAGDADNGLRTNQTNLKLGGLIGDKNLASVFTTISGGYGAVTDITLTTASGANHSYSGTIDGTRTLNVAGSGTQALSGNNSFDGGVNSSGTVTLALAHSNAAGTGTISFASTQTSFPPTFTLSGGINVANDIVIDSATGRNTINSISGSNTLSGDITINGTGTGNTIAIQNRAGNGTTFTIGGSTPNSTTITAADYNTNLSFRAAGGDTTAMGVINSRINAPNATFNINNDGFWTINSNANTWAATTLSAGNNRIKLGANDALATGARLDMGSAMSVGFVDLNGFNQTVAGLAGTTTRAQIKNDSTTADSTLTLAGLTADRSFSGAISDGSGVRTTSLVMDSSGRTQTLSGTNTYTGATTVTAGTLLVNGSTASGSAVTVGGNGTLGGSGTVNGTLELTGKLAPGGIGTDIQTLNAGTTTWNGGSVWNFDLSSADNTSDKLNITGDFTKGSAGAFAFDFMGATPFWNTTFTLVEWTGSTSFILADFDLAGSIATLGSGPYSTSSFTLNSNSLNFTAIPEPNTALAGLLLTAGLLRRRRVTAGASGLL